MRPSPSPPRAPASAADDPARPARLAVTAAAPPFDYNPSSMSQRVRIAILGLVACAIATYMALYQWGITQSVWDPVFGAGSRIVLDSKESYIMKALIGIPDAALGAWAYLTEVVLAFAGSPRRWQFRPWLVLLFGIDVIPLGLVSTTLVVLQGVSVGAWCLPCLTTAAISLTLAVLAWDEVRACTRYLHRVWQREHDVALLWRVFLGRPSERAFDLLPGIRP